MLADPAVEAGADASGAVRNRRVPSPSRFAMCTTTAEPSRLPSSWPGTVAEVLTTSTSPALSWSPRRLKKVCRMPAGLPPEPYAVATQAPQLGWLGRRVVLRRCEVGVGLGRQHGAHCERALAARVAIRSAAR